MLNSVKIKNLEKVPSQESNLDLPDYIPEALLALCWFWEQNIIYLNLSDEFSKMNKNSQHILAAEVSKII